MTGQSGQRRKALVALFDDPLAAEHSERLSTLVFQKLEI